MTRHHYADWIGPVSSTNRPNRFRTSDLRRKNVIASGLTRRDRGESSPDTLLERRARCAPFDGAETSNVSVEITPQQASDVTRSRTRLRHRRSAMSTQQKGHAGFTVGPIKGTRAAGLIRDNHR